MPNRGITPTLGRLRAASIGGLNLAHITFPHESARRRAVNLALPSQAATGPRSGRAMLPQEHAEFCRWLFSLAGLDAGAYRRETLARRLPACLRQIRAESVRQARDVLERDPMAVHRALSAMLVGVTAFFRDASVFEQLQQEILPQLARERPRMYVCSLGCSEGAEAYSLAMLLAEMDLLNDCYVLGTDCRLEAIETARRGQYDLKNLGGMSEERRNRFFMTDGSRWRVLPEIRNRLRWRVANLIASPEPGVWDIVSFRNTAMYLEPAVSQRIWAQLETVIRPGGLLILGKAERPTQTKRFSMIGPCLYQRVRR